MPGELESGREWSEVGDGPGVAVGAAGADEVTEEMEMEAQEGEQSGDADAVRRGWRLDFGAEREAW